MADRKIEYLLFDVESVADGELISKVRYPGKGLSPAEAIAEYRQERLEKTGSDFIPYTHQIPVSVVVAKVTDRGELMDIIPLDSPQYRPHVITRHFWLGWEKYGQPTLLRSMAVRSTFRFSSSPRSDTASACPTGSAAVAITNNLATGTTFAHTSICRTC